MALNSTIMFSMAKVLLVPISCYNCGLRSCVRLSRKNLKDVFMRVLRWHPWWCTACGTRFYLRRKVADDPQALVGPMVKLDSMTGAHRSRKPPAGL